MNSSCHKNAKEGGNEKAIEIEKLKRELERERMVNEVLKKNLEIRQKMERDSRLLDKKINTKR